MARRALVLVVALVALSACKHKRSALAELTKADGPVDRQAGEQGAWAGAPVGTKFFLGDAARTGDGGAELLLAGAARIAMQPHTILRFGGKDREARIVVELGAVTLTGTGSYGLAIGEIELGDHGAVRIAAREGQANTVELMVGQAQLVPVGGAPEQLQVGQVIGIEVGKVTVENVPRDAGVRDAPPADAAVPADAGRAGDEAQLEVTGKGAEVLAPGAKKWTKLPAGTTTLAKGSELRVDRRTTARLVAATTTLELAGASRGKLGDDLVFAVERGQATASVPAGGAGKVGVPGGDVELAGSPTSTGEARLDVDARGQARIAVLRGTAKVTGNGTGATLDLARGENATLLAAGTIHPGDTVIPKYFDFEVRIGETPSFTIHDPTGATAVRFDFAGKCGEGVVELDRDARFRTPRVSAGNGAANILVRAGGWAYRLRCTKGSGEGAAVASGRMVVVRDAGTRRLPKDPPRFLVDPDGRIYQVGYQSVIPNLRVSSPRGTGSATLHLAMRGTERTFATTTGSFDVPGKDLAEGEYTFWVEQGGLKSKVTTLRISFDQTAAQVYIESPIEGQPWGPEIEVRGATLPGWTAKIDAVEIPVDRATRRFHATVAPPSAGRALAIRLSHPRRGVHFYLRRGAATK